MAVKRIVKGKIKNSIIYADLLSAITALSYRNAAQPIVRDIIRNVVTAEANSTWFLATWELKETREPIHVQHRSVMEQ